MKLPWLLTEQQWLDILAVAAAERPRNRVMRALAYDAALRREELCSLRTDDLDPGRRMLRVRAETTKNRFERVVPYSAPTGVLLQQYLARRATISRARGPLLLSESHRNEAEPLSCGRGRRWCAALQSAWVYRSSPPTRHGICA
jgi:integrase